MAQYKFLRLLGADPEGGFVIKLDKISGEGWTVDADHVFELSKFMTEQGPQVGIQRMDTLPYTGPQIKFNPALVMFETIVPADSPIIQFIENGNAKAAEQKTGLILS